MSTERQYRRFPVMHKLGGLNEDAWSGTIQDGDTSDERNIDHSISGQWKTRAGMSYVGQICSAAAATSFHWNCDEAATSLPIDDQSGELASGVSTGSFSRLTVTASYYAPNSDETDAIHPSVSTAQNAYASFEIAKNFVTTAGTLEFYTRTVSDQVDDAKWTAHPPSKPVYLFGAHVASSESRFNAYVSTGGQLNWEVASGTSLVDTTTDFRHNMWHKLRFMWDYTGDAYNMYVDDVEVDSDSSTLAQPEYGTSLSFFNSPLATGPTIGTSAPVYSNWPILTDEQCLIDDITAWDNVRRPLKPTGIWNNVNQERVIFTAGNRIFHGTGFTEVTPGAVSSSATIVADTRKSAVEWQGNWYVTSGDTLDGEGILSISSSTATWNDVPNSPGGAKYLASYHNHIFAAGMASTPHAVRCSEFDDDDIWTTVSGTHIGQFNAEDDVQGIHPYAGRLIVGTRNSIKDIAGYIKADFVMTDIEPSIGVASHWSMKTVPLEGSSQALIWAWYDGLYMMVGGEVVKISQRIQTYWDTLNRADIDESHAVVNTDKGEYMLTVSTGSNSDHDEMVVFNYLKNTFSVWSFAQELDVVGSYNLSGTNYLYAANDSGHVYRLDSGALDDHKNIDAYLYTKWFDMDTPEIDKDFRALWVLYEETGASTMELGWENNWEESNSSDTIANSNDISLDPGTTTWDTMVWCTDAWGESAATKIKQIHLHTEEARGNSIRYRVRNKPTDIGASFNVKGTVQLYTLIEEYAG